MTTLPHQEAALQQLAAVPGVVGSLVFDHGGRIAVSAFPPVFDDAGLRTLAERLGGDGYFQEWMSGDDAALEMRYVDGHVLVRPAGDSWLLVLCTAQVNAQLLSMSMTQVVRRLGIAAPQRSVETRPPPPREPSRLERLRTIAAAELGDHAGQALEILAAAGDDPEQLLRASEDVAKLTRLFISKKKADEISRRMRMVLGS